VEGKDLVEDLHLRVNLGMCSHQICVGLPSMQWHKSPQGDSLAALSVEILDLVHTNQQNMQDTETRLQLVEDASNIFAETHTLMNDKVDCIYKRCRSGTILVNQAVHRNPHPCFTPHHLHKPNQNTPQPSLELGWPIKITHHPK
jgi:hypothetical protein